MWCVLQYVMDCDCILMNINVKPCNFNVNAYETDLKSEKFGVLNCKNDNCYIGDVNFHLTIFYT